MYCLFCILRHFYIVLFSNHLFFICVTVVEASVSKSNSLCVRVIVSDTAVALLAGERRRWSGAEIGALCWRDRERAFSWTALHR